MYPLFDMSYICKATNIERSTILIHIKLSLEYLYYMLFEHLFYVFLKNFLIK